MSQELRVKFLGDYPDARKVVSALDRIVSAVSAAAPQKDVSFRISGLGLGSVVATIAPPMAAPEIGEAAFEKIVSGLAQAEAREGIPDRWDGGLAREVSDLLAVMTDDGIDLDLFGDGEPRRVHVTKRAREHLNAALRTGSRDSIGSVIGRLESLSIHKHRWARLWPERLTKSVEVRFEAEHLDLIRDSLGLRVEAYGRLRRDRFGAIEYLAFKGLHVLPSTEDSPPISGLVGLNPDAGMSAAEYLREIRGKAL